MKEKDSGVIDKVITQFMVEAVFAKTFTEQERDVLFDRVEASMGLTNILDKDQISRKISLYKDIMKDHDR